MRKKSVPIIIISCSGLILSAAMPQLVTGAIGDALRLCVYVLAPSLFPYMVFSSLLAQAAAMTFRQNGSNRRTQAMLIFLGAVSGYPSGAKNIAEMHKVGEISKEEGNRLLFFACNAGPAFIFGVVGALYQSFWVCTALFAIHLTCAVLLGLIVQRKTPAEKTKSHFDGDVIPGFSECLTDAVYSAVQALLKIGGLVCLFSVVSELEKRIFSGCASFLPFLTAFTELAAGMRTVAESTLPWTGKFMLSAAAISFGGLCVIMQTSAVLADSGLSLRHYLIGKALQAILSAALAWPVSKWLSPAQQTAFFPAAAITFAPWPWTLFSIAAVIVIFLQFPSSNFKRHGL